MRGLRKIAANIHVLAMLYSASAKSSFSTNTNLLGECTSIYGEDLFFLDRGCSVCHCDDEGILCNRYRLCNPSDINEDSLLSYDIAKKWEAYNSCVAKYDYDVFSGEDGSSSCICTLNGPKCSTKDFSNAHELLDHVTHRDFNSKTVSRFDNVHLTENNVERHLMCVDTFGSGSFYRNDGCSVCVCTLQGRLCDNNICKSSSDTKAKTSKGRWHVKRAGKQRQEETDPGTGGGTDPGTGGGTDPGTGGGTDPGTGGGTDPGTGGGTDPGTGGGTDPGTGGGTDPGTGGGTDPGTGGGTDPGTGGGTDPGTGGGTDPGTGG
ncbi:putative GPI-anchored adhesin-like protein PGA18, partial [Zancudomyces culisetae]